MEALQARWIQCPRTIDDSDNSLGYAQNILAGFGFVYNPDDQVPSTTSPP